jgi:hypothetical protein
MEEPDVSQASGSFCAAMQIDQQRSRQVTPLHAPRKLIRPVAHEDRAERCYVERIRQAMLLEECVEIEIVDPRELATAQRAHPFFIDGQMKRCDHEIWLECP